jgi:hypothetical protein
MSRHRYRVVFQARPTESFSASGYEDHDGIIEFFDADIPEDDTTGTRGFTASSIREILTMDDEPEDSSH